MSLTSDMLETLDAMLSRPRMYASSKESFEEIFMILFMLVAPHAYANTTNTELRRAYEEFRYIRTGSAVLLLSVSYDTIEALAADLRVFRDAFLKDKTRKHEVTQ